MAPISSKNIGQVPSVVKVSLHSDQLQDSSTDETPVVSDHKSVSKDPTAEANSTLIDFQLTASEVAQNFTLDLSRIEKQNSSMLRRMECLPPGSKPPIHNQTILESSCSVLYKSEFDRSQSVVTRAQDQSHNQFVVHSASDEDQENQSSRFNRVQPGCVQSEAKGAKNLLAPAGNSLGPKTGLCQKASDDETPAQIKLRQAKIENHGVRVSDFHDVVASY